jgi:hypothetical protein
MIIRREKRTKNFTVIDNDIINDPRLDWRDLGLLVYLLSKPDKWEICTAHLIKVRKSGRDAIYTSLKVLCDCGYASKKPNPAGGWNWTISENPNTEKKVRRFRQSESGKSEYGKSEYGKSEYGKSGYINKY